MKLDTTEQRQSSVGSLIARAFAFQETMNTEDNDEDHDWCGASVVLDDLAAAEEMMNAEMIFRDTLAKISSPRHDNFVDKEAYASAFEDGFDSFISDILLSRLYHAADILNDWGFRTEGGKKFQEEFSKELSALIDVYENFDELLTESDDTFDIDTPDARLKVVMNLFNRAKKIDDAFRRDADRLNPGDVIGLVALMERLTALQDLIHTESLWEEAFANMHKVSGVSEDVREKFIAASSHSVFVFVRMILMQRIELAIRFAQNDFSDRRLVKFQKDFRETLQEILEVYEGIVPF